MNIFSRPSKINSDSRKYQPQHGQIIALYGVIYDKNLKQNILVPVTKADIQRGRINQGQDW